jgi:hypothetical protein
VAQAAFAACGLATRMAGSADLGVAVVSGRRRADGESS